MGYGIGSAVSLMRDGGKVTRVGWNGKGQYLMLQVPDEHSKMTLPFIYITTVQGDLVPWLASQTDILATDWQEVVEGEDASGQPEEDELSLLRAWEEAETNYRLAQRSIFDGPEAAHPAMVAAQIADAAFQAVRQYRQRRDPPNHVQAMLDRTGGGPGRRGEGGL